MNTKDIRRDNLRNLLNSRFDGKLVDFEKATGMFSSNLSKYLTENIKHRVGISSGTARRIEQSVGLSLGWLDIDHGSIELKKLLEQLTDSQLRETENYMRYLLSR